MRISFTVFLICCFTAAAFGQSPPWLWAKDVQFSAIGLGNRIQKVVTDKDGNTYAVGQFNSPIVVFGNTTPLYNLGGNDVFVIKYGPSGNVLWARQAGGMYDEGASGVGVDSAGNCYVTGQFTISASFGSYTLNASGSSALFIAKYSPSGNVLWAKQATPAYNSLLARSMAVDAAGGCYITGFCTYDAMTFGSITLPATSVNNVGYDLFVVKYDATGAALWAKRTSNFDDEIGKSIAIDGLGNCYVTGSFNGSSITIDTVGLSYPWGVSDRMFTVKIDPSGTALWIRTAAGYINSTAIAADSAGNSYLTGTFYNYPIAFDTISLTPMASQDMYVVKYDPAGGVAWAKRAGGSGYTIPNCIAAGPGGSVSVAGDFSGGNGSFGSTTLPDVGNYYHNVFVTRFNDTGGIVWARGVGGTGSSTVNTMAVSKGGETYVAGDLGINNTSFGSTTLINSTTGSGFIAKLASCTGAPLQPGAISAPAALCAGGSGAFSIPAVAGAASYLWTLPSGWTGTSTSNSITVTAGASSGTVAVVAVNACGTGLLRSLAVSAPSPVPAPQITQNGSLLIAPTGFATYQWYNNNTAISGATGQTYAAAGTGNYQVQVTSTAGCTGLSNAIALTTSISEEASLSGLAVYPNPATEQLRIVLPSNTGNALSLRDLTGKELLHQAVLPGTRTATMNIGALPAGLYLLAWRNASGTEIVTKVTKQ